MSPRGKPDEGDEGDQGRASREIEEPAKPTRMHRQEQQIGYVLAGVASAGGLVAASSGSHNVVLGGLAVAGGGALLVAVRHGHRIITAFAGFLVGLVLSTFFVPLELALVVFSGYLMMRTSNAQAKVRRSQATLTPAERRAAAEARAAARARRRTGEPGPPATARTPAPNRRYTPPKAKPTKKAPPDASQSQS